MSPRIYTRQQHTGEGAMAHTGSHRQKEHMEENFHVDKDKGSLIQVQMDACDSRENPVHIALKANGQAALPLSSPPYVVHVQNAKQKVSSRGQKGKQLAEEEKSTATGGVKEESAHGTGFLKPMENAFNHSAGAFHVTSNCTSSCRPQITPSVQGNATQTALQQMATSLQQSMLQNTYAQLLGAGADIKMQLENPSSSFKQKAIPMSFQQQQPGYKRAPLPPKKGRRGPMNSSSQYRGVTFYRRTQRWEAHVWRSGKQVYLGGFRDEEAAARVYDKAVMKLRGSEADTNFDPAEYVEEMKELKADECSPEEFILKLRKESKKQNKLRKEMDNGHHSHELKRARYLEKTLARRNAENQAALLQNVQTLPALAVGSMFPQTNVLPILNNNFGAQLPLQNSAGIDTLGLIQAQQSALKNLNKIIAQNFPTPSGFSMPELNQVPMENFQQGPGTIDSQIQLQMMQNMLSDSMQPQSMLQNIQNQALLQAMAKPPALPTTTVPNFNIDQIKDILNKQLNQ